MNTVSVQFLSWSYNPESQRGRRRPQWVGSSHPDEFSQDGPPHTRLPRAPSFPVFRLCRVKQHCHTVQEATSHPVSLPTRSLEPVILGLHSLGLFTVNLSHTFIHGNTNSLNLEFGISLLKNLWIQPTNMHAALLFLFCMHWTWQLFSQDRVSTRAADGPGTGAPHRSWLKACRTEDQPNSYSTVTACLCFVLFAFAKGNYQHGEHLGQTRSERQSF